MRVSTWLTAVLLVAGVGACDSVEEEQAHRWAVLDPEAEALDPFDPPVPEAPASSTAAFRYVALMAAGDPCPEVDGWTTRRLFHLTQPARDAWAAWDDAGNAMPPVLERFCVYIALDPPLSPPHVPGAVRVDADVNVVMPQSTPTVEQARADRLLSMLGATAGPTPASDPYLGDPQGLPYVAIVDTADSTLPGVAASYPGSPSSWSTRHRHGLSMASLVDRTRCTHDQPHCLARQFRAQAFPFDGVTEPEAVPSGGQWASLGSLASALGESVAGWRVQADGGVAPLVLNMSLGWDPEHGTVDAGHAALLDPNNPDPSVPATVQAVHSVLAWASCQGVVSVAASGNVRGSTCDELGPVAPASWESLPVVPAGVCSNIAGPLASTSALPRLTYGAGGMAGADVPIANARVNSLPPRLLYAHQGVLPSGTGHTSAWTGSSIASAALASMVASVRSHDRARDAVNTMHAIDTSGSSSAVDPTWLQPWVSQARRLTFEGVFLRLFGTTGPYRAPMANGLDDAIAAEILGQPQMAPDPTEVELEESEEGSQECGPSVLPLSVPPESEALPPTGWTSDESRPQPHVPICPTCPVLNTIRTTFGSSPKFSLFIRLDSAYDPQDIKQAVLAFDDPNGKPGVRVVLPNASTGSLQVVIDLSAIKLPAGGESVEDWLVARPTVGAGRLDFVVDQGQTAQLVSQVVDVVR